MKRKLTEEEMNVYKAPFTETLSRRPVWRFPNDIPVKGEPNDTAELFPDYSQKLT